VRHDISSRRFSVAAGIEYLNRKVTQHSKKGTKEEGYNVAKQTEDGETAVLWGYMAAI